MHAYYAPQMLVFVLVLFSAFTENSIFADDVSSDTNNTPATQTGTVIDPRSKTSVEVEFRPSLLPPFPSV